MSGISQTVVDENDTQFLDAWRDALLIELLEVHLVVVQVQHPQTRVRDVLVGAVTSHYVACMEHVVGRLSFQFISYLLAFGVENSCCQPLQLGVVGNLVEQVSCTGPNVSLVVDRAACPETVLSLSVFFFNHRFKSFFIFLIISSATFFYQPWKFSLVCTHAHLRTKPRVGLPASPLGPAS